VTAAEGGDGEAYTTPEFAGMKDKKDPACSGKVTKVSRNEKGFKGVAEIKPKTRGKIRR